MIRKVGFFDTKYFLLYFGLLVLGGIYVGNTWSPSSYSLVLELLGLDYPPDFGVARSIRSDEWAVQTPLTQALVLNNFERINEISLYKEDLRINYGLPILDWGMLFKPAHWGYLILPPAYAFSLYYYLLFAIFLVGYTKIIELMGVPFLFALFISIAFYFTGSVQFWWTVNAPTFAFFPWCLLFFYNLRFSLLYGLGLFWVLVCWQIGNLYPPFTYALALTGITWCSFVATYKNYTGKILFVSLLIGGGAVLVVYSYYYEYITVMLNTIYPGNRSSSGGNPFSMVMIISAFLPSLWFDQYFNLINVYQVDQSNISEMGMWGTLLPLIVLFFLNYKACLQCVNRRWKRYFIPLLLVTIILCWAILPIPSSGGGLLLLDRVPPTRLLLAFGIIINLISLDIIIHCSLKLNFRRLLLFIIFVLSLTALIKGRWVYYRYDFIIFIIATVPLFFAIKKMNITFISLSVMLFSIGVFFNFNPLFDSKIIFDHNNLLQKDKKQEFIRQDGDYGKVIMGYPGAILNGLGYKSGNHVLTTPQIEFWKEIFPDIPDHKLLGVFNRYAHIHLEDIDYIYVPQADVIKVPRKCFIKKNMICRDIYIDE